MSQLASTSAVPPAEPNIAFLCEEVGSSRAFSYFFIGAVIAGILLRVMIAVLPGDALRTPWGGGGDAATYLLLAHNIIEGKGFAYAGMPTALRAPVYPLLLAASLKLFGTHALAAIRWLQLMEGLGVVVLCAELARKLFGEMAGKFALVIALFSPTLAEMNGEILTEATATLLGTFFLFLLAEYIARPRWLALAGLGCAVGVASLTRFNMALLGIVALIVVLWRIKGVRKWQGAAVVVLLALGIMSPWLLRNFMVFNGHALFSTHGGMDALEGILTPEGRALPGDSDKLRDAVGWVPPVDVETNSPSRTEMPAEPALNRQCWKAAMMLWHRTGWGLLPIGIRKVSDFWLSADQLISTGSFDTRARVERLIGVIVYWAILSLAISGWLRLRRSNPGLARIFLLYAGIVTLMHLPFVMNTRLRMPFIDSLLAVLAGCGALALFLRLMGKTRTAGPTYGVE